MHVFMIFATFRHVKLMELDTPRSFAYSVFVGWWEDLQE